MPKVPKNSIEARVRVHLTGTLRVVLHDRTLLGVEKYGQRLEDNDQPERAKAVHTVQELLDGAQYYEWLGKTPLAAQLCGLANALQAEYGLTAEEIMQGGKQ